MQPQQPVKSWVAFASVLTTSEADAIAKDPTLGLLADSRRGAGKSRKSTLPVLSDLQSLILQLQQPVHGQRSQMQAARKAVAKFLTSHLLYEAVVEECLPYSANRAQHDKKMARKWKRRATRLEEKSKHYLMSPIVPVWFCCESSCHCTQRLHCFQCVSGSVLYFCISLQVLCLHIGFAQIVLCMPGLLVEAAC